MPEGAIGHSSYPLGSPRTSAALASPVTFTVPPSLLQAGTNTIAVQVALGYRNTPDISFELPALGLLGSDEGTAPVAPIPTGSLLSNDTVQLSWPAVDAARSEEHTSELQSLMRISYAVFCLKKKNN